ncbi:hypothetical protein ACFWBX_27250 [Streptomyces sp. NPDC059991]|uniref:hypothetical protein n=1 Tax=Streptomyces sp. NPDC059991 TaxID=3347028 RepID=UPI00368D0AE2
MTVKWTSPAASALRDVATRLLGLVSLLLILALSACSAQSRATSPKEVRKLAGGAQAQQSRKAAEEHLRAIVNAYAKNTPLSLGLVTVDDMCAGGSAKQWFFPTGDDRYKIRCDMRITAYYGADPRRIADVLDGILAAGDDDSSDGAPGSTIPFPHGRALVNYYRGHGLNPSGPNAPEPALLSDPSQTLSWDTVRSSQKKLVDEPDLCPANDPPVTRCLREPSTKTVADIRRQHGMVFKLAIAEITYYRVSKDGKTVKTWR